MNFPEKKAGSPTLSPERGREQWKKDEQRQAAGRAQEKKAQEPELKQKAKSLERDLKELETQIITAKKQRMEVKPGTQFMRLTLKQVQEKIAQTRKTYDEVTSNRDMGKKIRAMFGGSIGEEQALLDQMNELHAAEFRLNANEKKPTESPEATKQKDLLSLKAKWLKLQTELSETQEALGKKPSVPRPWEQIQ